MLFRYLGGSERLSENGSRQGTVRSSHMSGRQVPGSQISGNQISGRQISGSQASGRQNGQPTNKLLLSGSRQASQEGPAARLDPSRQRALPNQGPRQGPIQGGRQAGNRQGSSRQQVLRRAVSSPKLDLIPEQAGNSGNNFKRGGGGRGNSSVPRLQLDFSSSTSASTVVPHPSRRRAEERSRCGN